MKQTRYDLAFLVTLLTTSLPMDAREPRYLPHFLKLCAMAVKNMNERSVVVRYHPFAESPSFGEVQPQTIAFADAGCANLPSSGSTESFSFRMDAHWRETV